MSQVKSADADGYAGVQVTFGDKRASRVNKSQAGHFAKAGVQAGAITVSSALMRAIEGWSRCRRRNLHRWPGSGRHWVPPKVAVSPALFAATTSARIVHRTVTRDHPRARLDWYGPGPGPRVPRQAYGWPIRQRATHGASVDSCSRRCRARSADDQGCCTRHGGGHVIVKPTVRS